MKNTFILKIFSLLLQGYFCQVAVFNDPHCNGKRYKCGINLPNNVCVNISDFQGKIHDLQNCPIGSHCPWQNVSFNKPQYCQPNPPINLTSPGELCTQNANCYSNKCQVGVCKGKIDNQLCLSNTDCDVGYFCNQTSYCQPQKTFQQSCSNDQDCQNNCVCNLGLCAYYYSLSNNLSSNNPKACLYGYVNPINSSCQLGPHSEVKARPCQTDGDCILLDQFGRLSGYSQCQCGFNAGSFSYCSLAEGDSEYANTISTFQWILYTNNKCHTSLRYGPCQFMFNDEVLNYQIATLYYQMIPQLNFNDECIKNIYTPQFWTLRGCVQFQIQLMITILLILQLIQ